MAEKETPEIVETDVADIEEAAIDTLKPGGAPGESKAQMLDTFVTMLTQLGKEDLSDLFNRTLAQIGQEASVLPGNANADANKATIATKAVKEDLDEMFAGDDLSEEYKEKFSVIFEAAVNTRINLEMSRLAEEYSELEEELTQQFETKLEEEVSTIAADLTEKIDQYLNYTISEWMTENKLAIENSLRSDITEDFITGLHNLFTEHYIHVPSERVDVFAEMKNEIEELKNKLNEEIDVRTSYEVQLEANVKDMAFAEVSEGLVKTQVEKFRSLVEGVEFDDADGYLNKLEIIKEKYFTNKPSTSSTGLIQEEIDGEDESVSHTLGSDPMSKYVATIKKSAK